MISFVLLSTSYHPLFPPPPLSSSTLAPAPPPPSSLALPNFTLPLEYLLQPPSPDPERGWLDLNSGRLLDPVWVAFKHRSDVVGLETARLDVQRQVDELARAHALAEAAFARDAEEAQRGVAQRALRSLTALFARPPPVEEEPSPPPPLSVHARDPAHPRWDARTKRLDLRWNGVGAVLDFGFGRNADAVREGVADEARRRVERLAAADAARGEKG